MKKTVSNWNSQREIFDNHQVDLDFIVQVPKNSPQESIEKKIFKHKMNPCLCNGVIAYLLG